MRRVQESQGGRTLPIEIRDLAKALIRCQSFRGKVSAALMEATLKECCPALEFRYAEPSVEPVVRSGQPFKHLIFIRQGVMAPWTYPYSQLRYPFILGLHELLMAKDQERWISSYSAVAPCTYVELPPVLMERLFSRAPAARNQVQLEVLQRLSRFYWTSLATNGSNVSKVAAALVSRLALAGADFGRDRRVEILQKELVRLTATSRTGVSQGLSRLEDGGIIRVLNPARQGRYITGQLLIPDVDHLKDVAHSQMQEAVIAPLVEGQPAHAMPG